MYASKLVRGSNFEDARTTRLYLNKTEQVCDKTIYSKNTLSANLEMILSVLSNKGKALIIIRGCKSSRFKVLYYLSHTQSYRV